MSENRSRVCGRLQSLDTVNTRFLKPWPNMTAVLERDVNKWGLVSLLLFYTAILVLGILAAWWGRRKKVRQSGSRGAMIANRNISLCVGIFSTTATWVGGGYINGTAESVFTPEKGLIWTLAPVGYALSLTLGGAFFAKKMHDADCVTMLDIFEKMYGRVVTALLFIPAVLGDVFWTAAVLSALGASFEVIIGMNYVWAVAISAAIAVVYTFVGGLYSVVYTDVIQLLCIFFGMWLVVPFAMMHPAVTSLSETAHSDTGWLGSYPRGPEIGLYIDSALLVVFGGIPWQVYFQRVLSQRYARTAQILSYAAAAGCLVMAIPSAVIGAIAYSTDWNQTAYRDFGEIPVPACDYSLALPMVMQFLTPTPVAVIGLGAVSAAVMSSADSSILSSSSMFAKNIYWPLRKAASECSTENEVMWALRVAVCIIGAAAAIIAIIVKSIYGLWFLCSDLVYVVVFPQLLCVVHMPATNSYGSLAGFVVGVVLRVLGGEPLLGLDPVIRYPWYDKRQQFPYKTLTMSTSLLVIVTVSLAARHLAKRWPRLDRALFRCFVPEQTTGHNAQDTREQSVNPTAEDSSPPVAQTQAGEGPGCYINEAYESTRL